MVELRPKPDGTRISIEAGTDICVMYFGVRERNEILLPFLSEGLRRGDKCFAAVQEPDSADLIAKLANQTGSAVDLTISIDREQLEIRTSAEQLLSPDHVDPSVVVESGASTSYAAGVSE
ncbi:MEDS domain-containing protein [Mycobacterium intracellulare]|uniref:MEDS domain-containing protein n=1 Tax=Mycobacterium intracellulare TaxID=1767 RepID=A0AAE4UC28_MYCIT|nr:MEDS domain-containing protein [Mycobacterium intracellulare]MDV6980036.1 MEDS domain-containing protein [Mycobacterium intracellulare]MDV6985593.1 MEDS domain-containing protein [Mycobacterium intracellulare]MDV7015821.1 MEDS domain-containing protein [Mycobacterium intracellulare]MDV7030631.1 MEDS domain-containing protein [Mycobacterium intracellulare]